MKSVIYYEKKRPSCITEERVKKKVDFIFIFDV